MGGVAGHMSHLYDNPYLTFTEMKDILSAVSQGELDFEEKVDGQNLFLSYSVPEDKIKAARNKGNLRDKGLDAVELARKFADRGNLTTAFVDSFRTFKKAVDALSKEEKISIFGPDTNFWYNAEVMDPRSPNVINYDHKTLKIHDRGHFEFDRDEDTKTKRDMSQSLSVLDNALERVQNHLNKEDFNFVRKAVVNLRKLSDDEALTTAISRLNQAVGREGLSDNNTVGDYLFSRLKNGLDGELDDTKKEEIARYLLGMPGNIGLRLIKKGLSKEDLASVVHIINTKRIILNDAIEPIESVIHDFSVEMLKGLESRFIVDNKKETIRLQSELAKAVKAITAIGPENPESMAIMQKQLNKIKDMANINTPVEGVVFDYNGHMYKFTGNFAPLNQILGMFKYGDAARAPVKESFISNKAILAEDGKKIKDQKSPKRIALFPGKFKPPHKGHFNYVNDIAKRPDVDEVIVLISPVDYPEVSNEQSLEIWNEYLKNAQPNITAKIADYRSPVQAVYEFIADPVSARDGDTVLLIKSSKDVGDTRFNRAQSYADRNNPGVNVEDIEEDPIVDPSGKAYSAEDIRNLIVSGNKKEFLSYIPSGIDGDTIWNMLSTNKDNLNNLIDDTIEEMSGMGGGAVGGYSLPLGQKPVYPKKKRSKNNKPKVNRGKRQRRR
jgi:phosphopantetheine adenylyltransferase/uncharacterized protein YktA (UPF0223 family)